MLSDVSCYYILPVKDDPHAFDMDKLVHSILYMPTVSTGFCCFLTINIKKTSQWQLTLSKCDLVIYFYFELFNKSSFNTTCTWSLNLN